MRECVSAEVGPTRRANFTSTKEGVSRPGRRPRFILTGRAGGISYGQATAMATLPVVRLNEAARYKVNFHASPSEMGTIVACADLDH